MKIIDKRVILNFQSIGFIFSSSVAHVGVKITTGEQYISIDVNRFEFNLKNSQVPTNTKTV